MTFDISLSNIPEKCKIYFDIFFKELSNNIKTTTYVTQNFRKFQFFLYFIRKIILETVYCNGRVDLFLG